MESRLDTLYETLLEPFKLKEKYNENLNTIFQIGKQFPILSSGCLEYYLKNEEGRIDVNVQLCYEQNENLLNIDHRLNKQLIPSKELQINIQPILNFWDQWRQKSFKLHPFIDYIWLVYDIDSKNGILPWYYIMITVDSLSKDIEIRNELIKQILIQLGVKVADFKKFSDLFSSFPKDTIIRSIGYKTIGNSSNLRLYIVAKTIENIYEILKANKWQGDLTQLIEEIKPFSSLSYKFALSIDSTPELGKRVGIELWPQTESFDQMMQLLVEKNYCTSETLSDLMNWNGRVSYNYPNGILLNSKSDEPEKGSDPKNYYRYLPYIKFIYSEGQTMAAKAYLYFSSQEISI